MTRMCTTRFATFASCTLWMACHQAPDPGQLTAVDQAISATEAAMFTLHELDRGRYQRGDSLFAEQRAAFTGRFRDTLGRNTARILGGQFITLRASAAMSRDHEHVLADITSSGERLRALRADLASGALRKEEGASLIAAEQQRHTALIGAVHNVIDNYRALQQAWDRRDTVALLLSDAVLPVAP